jgi:uncharacterized protein (TIRG00374 family)
MAQAGDEAGVEPSDGAEDEPAHQAADQRPTASGRPDEAAVHPPSTKAPSRRTQLISALVTVVTLGIVFFYLFPKFGSYEDAWTYVQAMPAWSLWLLTFAVVLNVLVYVWPFLVALPGLRFGPGFVVRQTSFMISNTIPAGGAFGIAVQYGMLGSYGIGPGPTTSAIGINSVWNLLVTIGLPFLGALALLVSGQLTMQAALLGLASLAIIIVAGWLLRVILASEPGARRVGSALGSMAEWGLRIIRRPREIDLIGPVLSLRTNMHGTVDRRWRRLTVSNVAMQLTAWFVLFVALRGIQAESGSPYVTWSESLAAFALARLATFIPITPGGLGTVDAALVALLTNFGATNSQALAATLVWRAGTFLPQAALGLVTLIWWRFTARRRQMRRAGAAPSG